MHLYTNYNKLYICNIYKHSRSVCWELKKNKYNRVSRKALKTEGHPNIYIYAIYTSILDHFVEN